MWASDQKRFADELNVTKNFQDRQGNGGGRACKERSSAASEEHRRGRGEEVFHPHRSVQESERQAEGASHENRCRIKGAAGSDVTVQLGAVSLSLDAQAKGGVREVPLRSRGSTPPSRSSPTYLFYEPVMFYNRAELDADTTFYQGLIRLEVKTARDHASVSTIRSGAILAIAGLIALAAIGLGVLGAIIMANITVTPSASSRRAWPSHP